MQEILITAVYSYYSYLSISVNRPGSGGGEDGKYLCMIKLTELMGLLFPIIERGTRGRYYACE
jgi:hypothetical protein